MSESSGEYEQIRMTREAERTRYRAAVQARVVEWTGVAIRAREVKRGAAVQAKSSGGNGSSGAGTVGEYLASEHMQCHNSSLTVVLFVQQIARLLDFMKCCTVTQQCLPWGLPLSICTTSLLLYLHPNRCPEAIA